MEAGAAGFLGKKRAYATVAANSSSSSTCSGRVAQEVTKRITRCPSGSWAKVSQPAASSNFLPTSGVTTKNCWFEFAGR